MAVEHAMFKFGDLKVTSRDDRMTDRMTTKVHSSRRPRSSAARPISFANIQNLVTFIPIMIVFTLVERDELPYRWYILWEKNFSNFAF